MREKENQKYFSGVGRRKTAVATARIFPNDKGFFVNDKKLEEYFQLREHREKASEPFTKLNLNDNFKVTARVSGGGLSAQAEALRLAISRALVLFNEKLRPTLKALGFLKRDPREKERKKPGLKRARRAPQWQKR